MQVIRSGALALFLLAPLALGGCAAIIGAATLGSKVAGTASILEAAVQTARTAAGPRPAEAAFVTAGEAVSGRLAEGDQTLEDGTYFDSWFYEGSSGELLTIELRSMTFEPYLIVGKMVGGMEGTFERIELPEDEGEPFSRATVLLEDAGTYAILVNAFEQGAEGAYTLLVMSASRE